MKNFTLLYAAALLVGAAAVSSCDDDDIIDVAPPQEPEMVDGKYTVSFDLNYPRPHAYYIPSVHIAPGHPISKDLKPLPVREGYKFGGWYTSPECAPDQEWHFGTLTTSFIGGAGADSIPVNQATRLYARWEAPMHIKTVDDFQKIRENLYGWYILDADLDLSAYQDWEPIGGYEPYYENCDGEWWTLSFKGTLDGQGHTIRGLKMTSANPTMKGLFCSICNAQIFDLVVEAPVVDITCDALYTGIVSSVMKWDGEPLCLLKNITVKNADIRVTYTTQGGIFSGVTALVAGAWQGMIEDCSVDGKMTVNVNGAPSGELYVGGLAAEGYTRTYGCTSALEINCDLRSSGSLTAHIGGIQASGTELQRCVSMAKIAVSGSEGVKDLNVGGIIGSERYGTVANCASQCAIRVNGTPKARLGGVMGEFNATFGFLGPIFGIAATKVANSYATIVPTATGVTDCGIGGISGVGQPAPMSFYGMTMDYLLENCAYAGSEGLADSAVEGVHRFASATDMRGDALRSILERGEGSGQWIFTGDLPQPKP